MMPVENSFTHAYYASIIQGAQRVGYKFQTLRQFWDDGCPNTGRFILRHDLDANAMTLKGILDVEVGLNVPSTIFIRVTGNTYNPFDYRTFPMLMQAQNLGFELGLHSNFVEFAQCHGLDNDSSILRVLTAETKALAGFYNIESIACHRDVNYAYNSLPWLQANWDKVKAKLGFVYEAYDSKIMDNVIYVNETAEQKLGWRKWTPEDATVTGRSIILSTHPHWWFRNNPFEV